MKASVEHLFNGDISVLPAYDSTKTNIGSAFYKSTGVNNLVLRDPTFSYGIKRDDNGEVIRPAGTPMVKVAPSEYEYDLTDLDPDLAYTAYIEWVYLGETHYILKSIESDIEPTPAPTPTTAYTRISARKGQDVDLRTIFYRGGQPADPFKIYRVEIFRGSVAGCNIVDAIDVEQGSSGSEPYPFPLERWTGEITAGMCTGNPVCTSRTSQTSSTGRFKLIWAVPTDAIVPDIYFDVWYFFATDPGVSDLDDARDQLLEQCNRFWVYPDNWYVDGGLQTIRFGFEPLDVKFHKPERRPLEVGIMPLPLYDYDYNLVAPIIPYLTPSISIWTSADEEVIINSPCAVKLRQGSFRSNPYVISYLLDTCTLFKGTYRYRVSVVLPDGSNRVSGDFYFTVS